LNSLLGFEEVLGGGVSFQLTFLKDLTVSGRFLLEEVLGLANQLAFFVTLASLWIDWGEIPLFLAMASWDSLQCLEDWLLYVREELVITISLFSIFKLRENGTLGLEPRLFNGLFFLD
jgi:hypothetical protein